MLDVPRYSQMVHSGHYPQWGGGGQAWCSPTSHVDGARLLRRAAARRRPTRGSPDGHPQPWVDHAARSTFDHAYDGTGNWPFNTAYAGCRIGSEGRAFVTRLRSLREAERFIAAGIPLVASISFGSGELDGAPISAHQRPPAGDRRLHPSGDVVVNDPAAQQSGGVRRTYDRGQFEDAWLPTSGGLVYVVTPGAGCTGSRVGEDVLGAELDLVPPGGAVGHDVALDAGLHLAVGAGRPDPQHVVARLRR